MRSRITLLVFASLVVLTSSFLTYQVFSFSQQSSEATIPTSSITLLLPDQEYSLSSSDLATSKLELMIPSLDQTVPTVTYSPAKGILESTGSPEDFVINLDTLRSELETFGNQSSITLTPTYTLRDRYGESLSAYNRQLTNIISKPLTLALKEGSNFTNFTLDSSLLRYFLIPTTTELNVPPVIDQASFVSYLTSKLSPKQRQFFNSTVAYQNTQKAINLRFLGETANTVILGLDDGPSSKGELADRYLEIDLSQQKMYLFINYALHKSYRVSTGEDYPTPVGEYHILNKAPKAFSDIYNVWMPYWMGFKYASDLGAYLGIHEIAYAVDELGKPFYRHGYYIGDTMTGGCIAMEPKDSREVYDLSYVGMLLRVVP